ncbi:hypothetical protein EJO68_04150 [Variovorax atrisoli]|uniref:hypothetical protein n=1 Tax=Variovorax atrisoli TaxID=3394203 RepID=UPI000F7DD05B|nr:hypothetical protein [Variovorax sp. 369]RTD98571.1 hypothetical protein EJO68_04150 [Variovorax sp. 369]
MTTTMFAEPPAKPGRGGARPGAGRPRKVTPSTFADSTDELESRIAAESAQLDANQRYAEARAEHERIKVDQRALRLKVESGEYLPRAAFRAATATALAQLAQHLRGVGDLLESNGLDPEWCEKVEAEIDRALANCGNAFKATHERSNA